jgi:hypothetical protein
VNSNPRVTMDNLKGMQYRLRNHPSGPFHPYDTAVYSYCEGLSDSATNAATLDYHRGFTRTRHDGHRTQRVRRDCLAWPELDWRRMRLPRPSQTTTKIRTSYANRTYECPKQICHHSHSDSEPRAHQWHALLTMTSQDHNIYRKDTG